MPCTGAEESEGEDMSKGLFSLPFMRRAQQKRKLAAEKEAKQLLAELDGQSAALETPTLGRRNFGLQGGVQVKLILLFRNNHLSFVSCSSNGSDCIEWKGWFCGT